MSWSALIGEVVAGIGFAGWIFIAWILFGRAAAAMGLTRAQFGGLLGLLLFLSR